MESSGLPPPAAISKVPEVKMVSTSKVSSSAISSIVSVGAVDSDSALEEPMSGRVRTDPGTVRPAL